MKKAIEETAAKAKEVQDTSVLEKLSTLEQQQVDFLKKEEELERWERVRARHGTAPRITLRRSIRAGTWTISATRSRSAR